MPTKAILMKLSSFETQKLDQTQEISQAFHHCRATGPELGPQILVTFQAGRMRSCEPDIQVPTTLPQPFLTG
ncbi:unnamed protein product [Hymenolepis diminuta]|uniref:Uncharacterized protein n=1 Tax=Hymenolepis diminuta TaxID=6216 RepID=A0A0R3SUH0_HYMDI|nr:unnamed protein product [Hymenolepis diminuta]